MPSIPIITMARTPYRPNLISDERNFVTIGSNFDFSLAFPINFKRHFINLFPTTSTIIAINRFLPNPRHHVATDFKTFSQLALVKICAV